MQTVSVEHALSCFKAAIPNKPYCSDNLEFGLEIQYKDKALLKKHIQVNHPYYQNYLIFDVDIPAAIVEFRYSMIGIPTPNLIIENPQNGHCHFLYELDTPIYKTDASRTKPIKYAHAVYIALRDQLKADRGYSGLITKNALLSHVWRSYSYRIEPYTLKELARNLELNEQQALRELQLSEAIGLGRNCYIFDNVRHWAYIKIREFRARAYIDWFNCVHEHVLTINKSLSDPLTLNECKGISKSISRFCWKNDGYCYAMFIERQTIKGRLGGIKSKSSPGGIARSSKYDSKRSEAIKLKSKNLSNVEIAKILEVDRKTVGRWLKGGTVQA